MNSIITTYPGFQALPRGIKKMLMVSESLFFEDAKALPQAQDGQAAHDYGFLAHTIHSGGCGFQPSAAFGSQAVFLQAAGGFGRDAHLDHAGG